MDFDLTEEQQAVRDLAAQILGDRLPPERLRELEATDRWYADDVWAELARAELLGIPLPEADGGGGFGTLEACLIAEQLGRTVAPLPYLSAVVGAAMPIARFGSDAQRSTLLPGLIDGSHVLTVGLHEGSDPVVPALPATTVAPDGDGWRLDGEKRFVVEADRAAAIVVPAATPEGTCEVFVVGGDAAGLSTTRDVAVTGEPQWSVQLDGVRVGDGDRLGDPGAGSDVVAWTTERLLAGVCAMQTGVCEEALAITARYVSEREQFGVKLGTFQAVGQRVADAYIDTEGIRLTALQAAWRLDAGLPATEELLIAKLWASEGAQRVVHAAQHLHGGIGVDLDYPIHRYFRWAKVLELLLGGATPSLLRLGGILADRPMEVA